MNTKRYVLASLMTYLFILTFNWIFHGITLQDLYSQMPHLWRGPSEIQTFFPLFSMGQIIFTFLFGYIFIKGMEGKGVIEGFRYGLLIGVFYSTIYIQMYATQKLPSSIIIVWILGTVTQLYLAGGLFAAVYKGGKAA